MTSYYYRFAGYFTVLPLFVTLSIMKSFLLQEGFEHYLCIRALPGSCSGPSVWMFGGAFTKQDATLGLWVRSQRQGFRVQGLGFKVVHGWTKSEHCRKARTPYVAMYVFQTTKAWLGTVKTTRRNRPPARAVSEHQQARADGKASLDSFILTGKNLTFLESTDSSAPVLCLQPT